MDRWLYVWEPVRGDPAILADTLRHQLPRLLADATGSPRPQRDVDGAFTIYLTTTHLGVSVSAPVRVTVGSAVRRDGRTVLPISWRAADAAVIFPTFEGTVELAGVDAHRVSLAIAGAYRAPLGPLGAVGDATVLHGAVQQTLSVLVVRLAAALAAVGDRPEPEPARDDAEQRDAPSRGELVRPLRVDEVMSPSPVVFDPATSVRTAALVLASRQLAGAPVVAPDGELVGVLSETDLLAKAAPAPRRRGRRDADRRRRAEARTVAQAATRPARTTVPEAPVADAARAMLDAEVSRLVVVDGGEVVGIVSRHDVLRALLRSDDEIEAAVADRLRRAEGADLTARSNWGEVALTGHVDRRAVLDRAVAAARDVDGVIGVDADEVTVTGRRTPPTARPAATTAKEPR